MGLSCPLGISRFVPAKAKFVGVIFWPYNKSFIDQACSVKLACYWPRSFLRFYGPRLRLQGSPQDFGKARKCSDLKQMVILASAIRRCPEAN